MKQNKTHLTFLALTDTTNDSLVYNVLALKK